MLATEIAVRRLAATGLPFYRCALDIEDFLAWRPAQRLGNSCGVARRAGRAGVALVRDDQDRDGNLLGFAVEQRLPGAAAAGHRRHDDNAGDLRAEAGGGPDRGDSALTAADQPDRKTGAALQLINRLADRRGIAFRMTVAEQRHAVGRRQDRDGKALRLPDGVVRSSRASPPRRKPPSGPNSTIPLPPGSIMRM